MINSTSIAEITPSEAFLQIIAEGASAFKAGITINKNPYTPSRAIVKNDYTNWRLGFLCAEESQRQKDFCTYVFMIDQCKKYGQSSRMVEGYEPRIIRLVNKYPEFPSMLTEVIKKELSNAQS